MRLASEIIYASDGDEITTDGIIYSSLEPTLTVSKINYVGQSANITTAMYASQREISYYGFIHFPSGAVAELDMSKLESMNLLEEMFAENSTPLGAVSSNELVLSILNQNKDFSPSNVSSPYYNELLPNIPLDVYVGIKLLSGVIEYLALGTFYTTDWETPSNSLMANIVCNDRLFNLFNSPMPQIPIQENINMSTMFTILFTAMGLTAKQFEVDALPYGVSIAALPEGEAVTIRSGLQQMSEQGLCNVFVSRKDGKIRVLRNNNVEPVSYTWTDSDMIINADIQTKYSNIMSQVEITYHVPHVGEQVSVLSLENVEIPIGGIIFSSLFFDSVIGDVENVKLIGAINSTIDSMTIGAKSISLTISNTGVAETVAIEVYGRSITTIDAIYTVTDTAMQAIIGNVKFTVPNTEYIQSREEATIRAQKILSLVTDTSAYVQIEARGDPAVELINSILINDVTDSITNLAVVPIRIENNFTNGIDCKMVAVKKSVREAS